MQVMDALEKYEEMDLQVHPDKNKMSTKRMPAQDFLKVTYH